MKKVLSYVLSVCLLLCTATCTVSATSDITEIKDGAVLEFEQYAGEENRGLYNFTGDVKYGTPYGTHVAYTEASDGAFLALAERIGATKLDMTVPVNVTESGWYTVTLISTLATTNGNSMGPVRITMNESTISNKISEGKLFRTAQGAATDTAVDADCFYYSDFHRFTATAYLDEGVQDFHVNISANTSGSIGIKALLDCLQFQKTEIPSVSAEKETILEMEDYLNSVVYTHPDGTVNTASHTSEAKASGGALMDVMEKSNVTSFSFRVPMKVTHSGLYEINLVSTTNNGASTSILSVYNGEEKLVDSSATYAKGDCLFWGDEYLNTEFRYYYGIYDHVAVCKLNAGEYILTLSAPPITNSPGTATKFVADCLKFKMITEEIPENGRKFELEDCEKYIPRTLFRDTNTDGCTYVYIHGGDTLNINMTLNVLRSGRYNMIYHGSPYLGGGRSLTNFYLDDTWILDNNEATCGTPITADGAKDYYGLYLDGYEFCAENIYIPSGIHDFRMEVVVRPESTVAFAADYIEFIPLEDEAILENQAVLVKAYYDTPVSGTFIIALYSGKELIGIHSFEEMDCLYTKTSVPYVGVKTPDNLKIMVWEDLTGLVPVALAKTLPVK